MTLFRHVPVGRKELVDRNTIRVLPLVASRQRTVRHSRRSLSVVKRQCIESQAAAVLPDLCTQDQKVVPCYGAIRAARERLLANRAVRLRRDRLPEGL